MFSLICVWINGWVNNRKAGDLRRYCGHYDVSVMGFWHPMCVYLVIILWVSSCRRWQGLHVISHPWITNLPPRLPPCCGWEASMRKDLFSRVFIHKVVRYLIGISRPREISKPDLESEDRSEMWLVPWKHYFRGTSPMSDWYDHFKSPSRGIEIPVNLWPLLLTWFNFNSSMDK